MLISIYKSYYIFSVILFCSSMFVNLNIILRTQTQTCNLIVERSKAFVLFENYLIASIIKLKFLTMS